MEIDRLITVTYISKHFIFSFHPGIGGRGFSATDHLRIEYWIICGVAWLRLHIYPVDIHFGHCRSPITFSQLSL